MQRQGTNGGTSSEVAEHFGVSTVLARTRLEQLCRADKLCKTNNRRQHPTNTNMLNVYMVPEVATNEPIELGPGEYRNVYDYIKKRGHDEDFEPKAPDYMPAATTLPGSTERIEEYRLRVERGQPIWNDDDMKDGFVRFGEIPGLEAAGRKDYTAYQSRLARRASTIRNET